MTAVLLGAPLAAAPTLAHPPPTTDHGVAPGIFHTLWAGDRDIDADTDELTDGSLPIQELANTTDIPLNAPSPAVEQWNRGDLQNFPATDPSVSIYPPDARLEQGSYIEDAFVEMFAVQPSTRARLSPSRQPLYVAPDGQLLGLVDYRVAVPADDTSGDRRVYWSLQEHDIRTTRVRVDGQIETTADGTHTPDIEYTAIDAYTGETHSLTLEADIAVQLRKTIKQRHVRRDEDCPEVDADEAEEFGEEDVECETRTFWTTTRRYPTETVTVSDSITVTEYDLLVAGFKARYPDGDLGLVLYKNKPWLGYSVPNGEARGVWRFYSARDQDFDTLVRSTESGDTTTHSPLHPLQVTAYPAEMGPTPSPRGTVTILDTYGVPIQPPTLPDQVHLDVVTQPYTASFGLATRVDTGTGGLSDVAAWGLVRGVRIDVRSGHMIEVPINRSSLTLTVLAKTEDTVTVRARLRDASTGEPINTAEREGHVVLAGDRVNTAGNGTVVDTLPRPAGGLTARYEPGAWWRNRPGYTDDSATVLVQGTILQVLATVYRIGVLVSVFLLGVFIIDRFTGWRVWPPWRRL